MSPELYQQRLVGASSTWVGGIPPRPDGMPWFSALFDGSLFHPLSLLVAHRTVGAWSCLIYSTLSGKRYTFLLRSVSSYASSLLTAHSLSVTAYDMYSRKKRLPPCLASYGKIGPSHQAWKSRGNVNRYLEEEPGTTRATRTHRHYSTLAAPGAGFAMAPHDTAANRLNSEVPLLIQRSTASRF